MLEGANDRDKRKGLKSFIRSQKVGLVCLQETKILSMSIETVCSLGVVRFLDWRAIDMKGALGSNLEF